MVRYKKDVINEGKNSLKFSRILYLKSRWERAVTKCLHVYGSKFIYPQQTIDIKQITNINDRYTHTTNLGQGYHHTASYKVITNNTTTTKAN